MSSILKTENLVIGYGENPLHKNLNLSLEKGVFTGLLGKNGTGKTTLVKTLLGDVSSIQGEVILNGKQIAEYSSKELSQTITFVHNHISYDVLLTVEETVALGRIPYLGFWGKHSSKDEEFVTNSLEIMGITHLKKQTLNTLSDGEKQKVMLAKALVQDTEIIILDEPLAFLDYPSKLSTLFLLQKIVREQNKAILMIAHEVELMLQCCDYLWLFSKEDFMQGSTEKLILDKTFNTFFDEKEIQFNTKNGRFEMLPSKGKKVAVLGEEGERKFWLINFLQKNQFIITNQPTEQSLILVEKEHYVLSQDNDKQIFKEMSFLLIALNN